MGFLFILCRKKQLKVSSIQAGTLPLGRYFLYKRDEETLGTEKRRIRTNQSLQYTFNNFFDKFQFFPLRWQYTIQQMNTVLQITSTKRKLLFYERKNRPTPKYVGVLPSLRPAEIALPLVEVHIRGYWHDAFKFSQPPLFT